MRKLVCLTNITPDGRAGHAAVLADDELHSYVNATLDSVDTLVFARPSFELLYGYWPEIARTGRAAASEVEFARTVEPMPKLVFSKTRAELPWNARVARDEPARELEALKREQGKDLLILGSPSLVAQLSAADLIDVYHLVLHPILPATGPFLLPNERNLERRLTLAKLTPFRSGAIALRYTREPVDQA